MRAWDIHASSAFRVVRSPVARDGCALAQPDTLVTLHVLEQASQCSNAAGAADDPPVQADAHHPRPPFRSHAVQPVERIAAVREKLLTGAEIATTLQAAVIGVEAIGDDEVWLT
jgi:hypothetical protein